MPNEQERLSRFLAGEPRPENYNAGWGNIVRRNRVAGKTTQRLKIVRRPFTDYTRFLMSWTIPSNVEAGEDYRILDATDRSVEIPEQDFWLFDDEIVALLNFNVDGSFKDQELADSADLPKYLHWRDLGLSEAVPFGDYGIER
ncbi:MAG TPA: hypothetical protein VHF06_10080 [Pseudonocardiaceae bacterium]|nr:hypothetical protein [Pseudonocardiaceae bacterium]